MSKKNMGEYLTFDYGHPVYRFPNGYGASVVCQPGSYGFDDGLMELAVLKFNKKDYDLVYDTPITEDVMGFLDDEQINTILEAIFRLDENGRLKEDDPWFNSEWA